MFEKVKQIQIDRGFTDTQMSTLLGYKHRSGWTRLKHGADPGNVIFEARAIRAFPELRGTN